MKLRKATLADGPAVVALYREAQAFLAAQGIDQWQDGYPNEETFQEDVARGESWLSKAAALDHVCVCLGVNDILQGRTAQALWADLCAIRAGLRRANPGLRLTQFTIPPFDLEGGHLEIWRQINGGLRDLARNGEIELFDIAQVLARPHPNGHLAAFGPHPDGAGGAAVCRSFMDWLTSTSKNKEEN